MKQKALWRYGFGNKAFIFSLDAIIAVVVMTIVFGVIGFYTSRTTDSLPVLQMSRTGSDIVNVLYNVGEFSGGMNEVETYMNEMIPINYDMRIEVIDSEVNLLKEAGNSLPENKMIISGRRVLARTVGNKITNYATIQYWIWLK